MNRDEIAIAELIKDLNPTDKTVHSLWYDWFCKASSLDRKGRNLLGRLRMIAKDTKKFNTANTYVFFKNNCPCWGDEKLYEDFRICDMETGKVIYTVTPRDPNGDATVYGKENQFEQPLIKGTWTDVKKFFQS